MSTRKATGVELLARPAPILGLWKTEFLVLARAFVLPCIRFAQQLHLPREVVLDGMRLLFDSPQSNDLAGRLKYDLSSRSDPVLHRDGLGDSHLQLARDFAHFLTLARMESLSIHKAI